MNPQNIVLLGATGSIGESTLRVIRNNPEKFNLTGISFHSNQQKAREIIAEFGVKHVYCSSGQALEKDLKIERHSSYQELLSVPYDMVIIAIIGAAGVEPAYIAANQGKKILLANKESLVMAGSLIMQSVEKNGATILPLDSEHNSIFRLLEFREKPVKISITASGGALRDWPPEKIKSATVADVLKHPTWSMGAKITVDSASMVNKSLEIMEACHLFNLSTGGIDAVIHPESYVHAIIRQKDGSCFFHVYKPDMVYSIAYSMHYPDTPPEIAEKTTVEEMPALNFMPIDPQKYGGFYLGLKAGEMGGVYPAVFNAANEQAVHYFLKEQIDFASIVPFIDDTMSKCPEGDFNMTLEGLYAADAWSRGYVKSKVEK